MPVFLFLINDKNEIYLQRRANTGFLDGFFEPPAGGLDDDEFPQDAACREAMEEAGITVLPNDCEFFHAFLNLNPEANPNLGLMFRTRKWEGTPHITEPHLCDAAGFYAINELPDKVIPQARDAVLHLLDGPAIELSTYVSLLKRIEEQKN